MKIDGISSAMQPKAEVIKQPKKAKETSFQDQLALSKEAIQMTQLKAESRISYLEEIQSRVRNGYYDQNTVINKVAESILNSDDLVK